MRILFSLRAAIGHFHPLVPLARAAHECGHDVAFAMPPSFQSIVERLGFRWLAAGLDESFPKVPSRKPKSGLRRSEADRARVAVEERCDVVEPPSSRRAVSAMWRASRRQHSWYSGACARSAIARQGRPDACAEPALGLRRSNVLAVAYSVAAARLVTGTARLASRGRQGSAGVLDCACRHVESCRLWGRRHRRR
jgi:UDP:flavonoid glycosyltransferase YjiC (YdhE family)